MSIKRLVQFLYGLFATLFLIAGTTVLLLRTSLLPTAIRTIVMNAARDDMNAAHLIQEFGSMLVFAGLISIWFIRHYEQSKFFHWAMTTFWALFSVVHWFYVGGPIKSIAGPSINTIPFLLFAVAGLLRNYTDKQTASAD